MGARILSIAQGLRLRIKDLGFRVSGLGFKV